MGEQTKKLYRLPDQGIIAGVCAGVADYFDTDVTLVRVVFVALIFMNGLGLLLYVVLAVMAPVKRSDQNKHTKDGVDDSLGDSIRDVAADVRNNTANGRLRNFLGLAVIILGVWLLLVQIVPGWVFVRWDYIWPSTILAIGLLILINSRPKR